jgi:sugar transferase (PEP-CTERM/EpsH1 system associated)
MRILWLNAGLLLPLDKGGKLRTWHVMRHLAARHEITYLSFEDASQTEADRIGMRQVCGRLETVPRVDAAKGTWRFYADAGRYVADAAPYAVAKYRSRAFADRLAGLVADGGFDVVVCDFLPPAVNMPRRLPCPSLLFTHNVEAEIWRRHAETVANPLRRALLAQQHRRMLRFERGALARFDRVLAVSDADARTFARLYPGALRSPVHVVRTGVETDFFVPAPAEAVPTHMVFTGSMDWLPNEDGVTYFCREILPRIRRSEPDATLSIVGRAPTPAVKALAGIPGVEVTGRVDDVRPHIARAAVYVVPLRIGGGTRLKIFEAMSMAKAVVSTAVGAEGLPVTNGRDIDLADEPSRFAHAVVRLMRDAEARRAMEAAARALVVERYDWSAVAVDFERALANTAEREPLAERAIA